MNKIIAGAIVLILIGGGIYAYKSGNMTPEPDSTATTTPSTNNGGGVKVVLEEGETTVGLGETAVYKGVLVTPMSVVEDSRCPADVQCIQAGTVRVKINVSLATGLGTSSHTVKLGEFITTDKEKITFVKVTPEVKKAGVEIPPGTYRFTVKIEKRTPPPTASGGCFVGGCSSQLCSDAPPGTVLSTCEWREEYTCFQTAVCERQTNGQCGWTQTDALKMCLDRTM